MLLELEVKDFALIDHLNIQFHKGLNILTGETGVGKSIIIDAVNMAIGERADREYVRSGAKKAVIQAIFSINNLKGLNVVLDKYQIDIDDDKLLIVSREIYSTGRSISRVNGVIVNQSILKSITEKLIDIHGQHQHQSLLNTEFHINVLDVYGGKQIEELLDLYYEEYENYILLRKELDNYNYDGMERERKIDLLKFQLEEIDSAKLQIGEEEVLNQQRSLLSNSEKIYTTLAGIYEDFYNSNQQPSVLEKIAKGVKTLRGISTFDTNLNHFYSIIEEIQYRIEDVTNDIRNYKERIDFNPQLLQEIEKRLDVIHGLKRKYGASIEEILIYREKIGLELDSCIHSEERILNIKNQLKATKEKLQKTAVRINQLRVETAKFFEAELVNILSELNMKKVSFSILVTQQKDHNGELKLTPNGSDKVEFMISTNIGEPLKPLCKIVSGGEVSRIMLALKTILAELDNIPVLIFDEIDTGISGITAQIVAEKLHHISKSHQVICITHLPQIASMAGVHFMIDKESEDDMTKTIVKELDWNNRLFELGRLLGGDVTEITLKHAEEMINKAHKKIKAIN